MLCLAYRDMPHRTIHRCLKNYTAAAHRLMGTIQLQHQYRQSGQRNSHPVNTICGSSGIDRPH